MKTYKVATLNARKFCNIIRYLSNWGVLVLLTTLLVLSCNSDDISPTDFRNPVDNEKPVDNENPIGNQHPIGYEIPSDSEFDIVYTDLVPDYINIYYDVPFNIDLNDDEIVDFSLVAYSGAWEEWIEIYSRTNMAITFPSFGYPIALPLEKDMVIYDLSSYSNGVTFEITGMISAYGCYSDCYYDWKDKKDKFLGLKFKINEQFHYGWIRMDVSSHSTWVVKHYAYNAIPNMPILAGQME